MIISPSSWPKARLVASTVQDYYYPDLSIVPPSISAGEVQEERGSSTSNLQTALPKQGTLDQGNFRNLLWSADGTTLVTASADNAVRSFILPPSLLDPGSDAHLKPYSEYQHPAPIYATATSPYYSLASPETTLILTSPASLPIRLVSPFAHGILARYPLVNLSTEKWIAPHSLLFTLPPQDVDESFIAGASLRFLAGSQNEISLFDVSRDGSGPVTVLPTCPSNRRSRRGGGGNGMAGIVSAMTMSSEGILAAGTFSRGVGLYDAQGMGDTIGTWSLKGGEDGNGITSLQWSRCGRYLTIAERNSDGLGIWDIRGTGQKLAWLQGRKALTMQRLGFTIGGKWNNIQQGEDVYAGGIDGIVRVWEGIGMREGQIESDWQWQAHEDAVSGIAVHACGSVVATCSGSRQDSKEYDSDDTFVDDVGDRDTKESCLIDNSVRVWSLDCRKSENDRNPP